MQSEKRKKPMHKRSSLCRPEEVAATILLFAFVVAGAFYLIFAPKLSFSENENRVLEQAPPLETDALLDGSFTDSLEAFVNDQFPLRTEFLSLNTSFQLLTGRKDLGSNYSAVPAEGGVYFGKKDHVYEVLLPNTTDTFRRNIQGLETFGQETNLPFWVVPVPSGSQEQRENLPLFAQNHDQKEELNYIQETMTGENVMIVDLFDTLGSWNGDFYYKTDHHWNTFGAYEGYKVLAQKMGFTPYGQDQFIFRLASNSFYGTLYSKAVNSFQTPDDLYLPEYAEPQDIVQVVGGEEHEGLYWEEYLDKKDKYSTFMGGNHSVEVVKNRNQNNGRKLLLLKDSYANSLVPFLCLHYSEIHVIDLRYYSQNVYDYIEENGITEAAAVYSMKQLCDVDISNKLAVSSK
ncbi:MAG: DHHW family protein [Hydrogeniiclostridium sp.]|mgnify:FL=1